MDQLVNAVPMARVLHVAALMAVAACAPTSNAADERASPLQEALQQSIRMREISSTFERSHPAKGLRALAYIRSLEGEGFACVARYVDHAVAGKGDSLGSFSATKVPIVDCARAPSGYDACARFRVSLVVNFDEHRQSSLASLVKQLGEVGIRDAYFVCEQTQLQDPQVLVNGLRDGTAVRID
ncbi:hypothetical protein [Caenimonas koreensis]|uniref:hypothetical protein n=1 Tax=Caenimonas koreensis TaxID=367474 RepID=UPI0037850D5D